MWRQHWALRSVQKFIAAAGGADGRDLWLEFEEREWVLAIEAALLQYPQRNIRLYEYCKAGWLRNPFAWYFLEDMLATAVCRLALQALILESEAEKDGKVPDALPPELALMDPYTGQPLVFRRLENGYELWSMGPGEPPGWDEDHLLHCHVSPYQLTLTVIKNGDDTNPRLAT
jgi:hypothetical protein